MTEPWVAALRAALGDRVHTQAAELAAVARDSSHVIGRPEALIYPETSEHVATAVRIARQHGVPIVPRGGGTSLTGATVPTRGGLVIAFNRMASILDLDVEERTALVQPGHPNAALDRVARQHGLRYTPDPSSRAASVIGGNIGTNAGGLHCLGHGVTADHVLGLEVVFGDGTIAWLEDTDPSDLRALVTGSEGTLAIVTCALVRLLPLPERLAVVVAGFEILEQAGACAERMVLEVPGLVACEFIDEGMLRALDHMAPGVLPTNVEAALLIEVEALEEGIDRALGVVVQCVEESGGSAREARSDEEIEIAWNARRSAFGALGRMHADSYTHDFATPRDRLVSSLRAATEIADAPRSRALLGRPPRRRQPPPAAALRRARGRGLRARPGGQRGAARDGARERRHADRRARHRAGEAARARPPVRRARARRHAPRQGRARPVGHPQSRQGACPRRAPTRGGGCTQMSPELRAGNASLRADGDETLAAVQAAAAVAGQFLPVDADDGTTVRELLQRRDGGPLDALYGRLRDRVLAAGIDGLSLGSEAVKDVTGYDLRRLLFGQRARRLGRLPAGATARAAGSAARTGRRCLCAGRGAARRSGPARGARRP